MKIILLVISVTSLSFPVFAGYNCSIEALEAGNAILKVNAKGQPTQLSENEMGLVLGEKGVHAIGMTGLINNQVKQIRVDFVSSENCEIKNISFENRGW